MKHRYLKMPYDLLINKELDNNAKNIYLALLNFRSGVSKKIKVSLGKISELTGLKHRQLTKHLNTLAEHNIISRSQDKRQSGEYGCNTYTILSDEAYFAAIPWEIAFDYGLSANAKIGYCIMKRFINLDNSKFICYMDKNRLAAMIGCSLNEVDKIKRSLKNAGLIEYERNSKQLLLIYEKNLNLSENRAEEIKQTIRSKNKVNLNESHSLAF